MAFLLRITFMLTSAVIANSRNLCFLNNGGCAHICTSIGGRKVACSCNGGMVLNQTDKRSCHDKDNCSKATRLNRGCQHKCKDHLNSILCSCNPGFALNKDGRTCFDVKPFIGDIKKWLKFQNVDYCAKHNGGCQDFCVNTLLGPKCVAPPLNNCTLFGPNVAASIGGLRQDDGQGWKWTYTLAIILIIVFIFLLCIICCCCGKFAYLKENICCKSFCSWKCCMTGCFCKCNQGEASEETNLFYHQVKIDVKKTYLPENTEHLEM